jgi:patatin-related protein
MPVSDSGETSTDRDVLTQEIRLAVVLTGGASLAVWMGGVAREINLLTNVSAARTSRAGSPATGGPAAAGVPSAGSPQAICGEAPAGADAAVAALYGALLAVLQVDVSVDVISGTSAGGINAALLGYANVRGADLGPLRDLWLSLGSLTTLLRTPTERTYPSLLRADGVLLPGLRSAFAALDRTTAGRPTILRPTSVFITTTIMRGEAARSTDSLGSTVYDVDHRGLFTFGEDGLTDQLAAARLALAARASAAFPGAFEPAYVPVRHAVDDDHPDMAEHVNAARSFYASDGGILVNRPIGPALQAVFDRPADHQVRRVLAYVVPAPAPAVRTHVRADPPPGSPPPFGSTLLAALGAAVHQSIASDLTRLRQHNEAVRAARGRRRRLMALAPAPAGRLADEGTYATYRRLQAERVAAPVAAAVLRIVDELAPGSRPPDSPAILADPGARERVRAAAVRAAAVEMPDRLPGSDDLAPLWRLGRPAVDAVKGILISMINEGYALSPNRADRAALAAFARSVHEAVVTPREGPDPLPLPSTPANRGVFATVTQTLEDRPGAPLADVAAEATRRWLRGHADAAAGRADLTLAWSTLGTLAHGLRTLFADMVGRCAVRGVVTPTDPGERPGGLTVAQRRAVAAETLTRFVGYLPTDRDRALLALVDLHLSEQALGVGDVLDQPVELVQVSADVPTALDPRRALASAKLTGIQLGDFGAFAKSSWRANDWMWGRLDGAGWLVRILLDPRRLVLLRDAHADAAGPATVPADAPASLPGWQPWLAGLLAGLASVAGTPVPADVVAELAFLLEPDVPVPPGLPDTARWVAAGVQRHIAATELAAVAAAVRDDIAAGVDPAPTAAFLDAVERVAAGAAAGHAPGRAPDRVPPPSARTAANADGAPADPTGAAPRTPPPPDGAPTPAGQGADVVSLAAAAAARVAAGRRPGAAPDHAAAPDRGPARADGERRPDRPVDAVAATVPAPPPARRQSGAGELPPGAADELLRACQVSAERLTDRANTPILIATLAQTVAVAVAWFASLRALPRTVRPAAFAARSVTRLAFELVYDVTRGHRRVTIATGAALLGVGLAGAIWTSGVTSGLGVLVGLVGLVMINLTSWRRLPGGMAIVGVGLLGVVAAAGVIPAVGDRLFPWLSDHAVPYLADHPWAWAAVFGLLVLPPIWSIVEAVQNRRPRR